MKSRDIKIFNWQKEMIKLNSFHNYIKIETEKKQIYLHHTGGGHNPVKWWQTRFNGNGTISTPFVICGNYDRTYTEGRIIQLYDEKYYGHTLGETVEMKGFVRGWKLNREAVQIELCNYGIVRETAKGLQPVLNFDKNGNPIFSSIVLKENEVVEYSNSFRGETLFHKYTELQLDSLYALLSHLCEKWDIDREFKGIDHVFSLSENKALKGESGIYSHVSCSLNKWDCHPQKGLIEILKVL